jgi:hypothetical protein
MLNNSLHNEILSGNVKNSAMAKGRKVGNLNSNFDENKVLKGLFIL